MSNDIDTVIFAPHPDDEIIGLYEVITTKPCVVIYDDSISQTRRDEAARIRQYNETKIKFQLFLKDPSLYSFSAFRNKNVTVYFPDPIYEYHPLHRQYGHYGEKLFRNGFDVIFYNTNMNAPYIHEVKDFIAKHNLLDETYFSQSDLWKYEAKYYLFEGRCKWIN